MGLSDEAKQALDAVDAAVEHAAQVVAGRADAFQSAAAGTLDRVRAVLDQIRPDRDQ